MNTITQNLTKIDREEIFGEQLREQLVARDFATIYTGDAKYYQGGYMSKSRVTSGTAATAYTVGDIVTAPDSLVVDQRSTAAGHIDSIEQLQVVGDFTNTVLEDMSFQVANAIDKYALNLPVVTEGVTALDNGNLLSGSSATSGLPFDFTSTTPNVALNAITQRFLLNNAGRGMFVVLSPYEATDITSYLQSTGYRQGDETRVSGFLGTTVSGLDIMMSNNLTHTVTLTLAVNPTAGDTFTVNGVVGTWRANGTASVAGDLSIGVSAAASQVILRDFINGTGTPGASTYIEVSADDRTTFVNASVALGAFNANTAVLTARGTIQVGASFVSGSNLWGSVGRYLIAGAKKALRLAIPSDYAEEDIKPVSQKHGREVVYSQVYGGSIYTLDKSRLATLFVK